jgi:chromosome segregation ATPase
VSLHIIGRREKTKRKHRAVDCVEALRAENAKLLDWQQAADEFFLNQDAYTTELETKVGQLEQQLDDERTARTLIEKDRDALERHIRSLEGQLADAERRLDVRTWAEAAVAKTQEMPAITVMPLHRAPFATTDPGRIPDPAA